MRFGFGSGWLLFVKLGCAMELLSEERIWAQAQSVGKREERRSVGLGLF